MQCCIWIFCANFTKIIFGGYSKPGRFSALKPGDSNMSNTDMVTIHCAFLHAFLELVFSGIEILLLSVIVYKYI